MCLWPFLRNQCEEIQYTINVIQISSHCWNRKCGTRWYRLLSSGTWAIELLLVLYSFASDWKINNGSIHWCTLSFCWLGNTNICACVWESPYRGQKNVAKSIVTSEVTYKQSCECVCVYTYFSSDILITGESRHKEKRPVSIIRTDSLLSLSETHTQLLCYLAFKVEQETVHKQKEVGLFRSFNRIMLQISRMQRSYNPELNQLQCLGLGTQCCY